MTESEIAVTIEDAQFNESARRQQQQQFRDQQELAQEQEQEQEQQQHEEETEDMTAEEDTGASEQQLTDTMDVCYSRHSRQSHTNGFRQVLFCAVLLANSTCSAMRRTRRRW